MSAPPSPKFPMLCFLILSLTMLIGGLLTLGGMVILFNHYPAGTPVYILPLMALNVLLSWIFAVLCIIAAWKLGKSRPKANTWAKVAWGIVAGFTVWTLLFNGLGGGSTGGIAELVIWSVLEALIARYLMKA